MINEVMVSMASSQQQPPSSFSIPVFARKIDFELLKELHETSMLPLKSNLADVENKR
ncbi:MAG: hypothetical protein ACTS73_09065 [Arsenophonus sp. NEOnobi-MAG3]